MIIVSNKPGQLGNLLFLYAHFLSYGLENNTSIINPAFYKYRSYFSKTKWNYLTQNRIVYGFCYLISKFLVRTKFKTSLVNIISLDWNQTVDLTTASELKSSVCFVQGWLFRSDELLVKHKDAVAKFFTPAKLYKEKLTDFFSQHFPNKTELLIGVHIRRGDYKTFENGRYYYSEQDYLEIIKKLADLFHTKNPHFLICSNESINLTRQDTTTLKITFAPGHELLDMYCLANCSYIVGPPSTYSMWSSFYGSVPLYMIKDLTKEIRITDFKIELQT